MTSRSASMTSTDWVKNAMESADMHLPTGAPTVCSFISFGLVSEDVEEGRICLSAADVEDGWIIVAGTG